jgi:hypothetical protein
LADEQQLMQVYADAIENEAAAATIDEYEQLAQYFAQRRNTYLAGKYYYLSAQYRKVFILLQIVLESLGIGSSDQQWRTP